MLCVCVWGGGGEGRGGRVGEGGMAHCFHGVKVFFILHHLLQDLDTSIYYCVRSKTLPSQEAFLDKLISIYIYIYRRLPSMESPIYRRKSGSKIFIHYPANTQCRKNVVSTSK